MSALRLNKLRHNKTRLRQLEVTMLLSGAIIRDNFAYKINNEII